VSLASFHSAVKAAAAKYAPQYGLSPAELEHALLVDANLEGGLGDTAAVGDGGDSEGRFQYNFKSGHGATLVNQGVSRAVAASDEFQANDWAPILASHLKDQHDMGRTGPQAIRDAIFNSERPAEMYPTGRVNGAISAANGLTGQSVAAVGDGAGYGSNGGGGGPGGAPVGNSFYDKLAPIYSTWKALDLKVAPYRGTDVKLVPGSDGNLYAEVPDIQAGQIKQANGSVAYNSKLVPIFANVAEYQQYLQLDKQVQDVQTAAGTNDSAAEAIQRAKFAYDSSKSNIDAENLATKYAAELKIRTDAAALATKNLASQTANQDTAMESFNGPRSGAFYAPSTAPMSPDAIYKKAVSQISDGLPDVPQLPYYPKGAGDPTANDPIPQLDADQAKTAAAIGSFDPRRAATIAAESGANSQPFDPRRVATQAQEPQTYTGLDTQNPVRAPRGAPVSPGGGGIFGAVRAAGARLSGGSSLISGSILQAQNSPNPVTPISTPQYGGGALTPEEIAGWRRR